MRIIEEASRCHGDGGAILVERRRDALTAGGGAFDVVGIEA
eukprot:CAMPEP_0181127112 /NCGR_PEP_ID=MMETSP1071-20121207/28014_1 /TAXON_ID=35127 /ORGANISM="Thalassiosira sp., Strain NH16" /LENGTH=40 /DNA_ID= /DNA_START= /DNA_END= /DNA_ORIENTATION=